MPRFWHQSHKMCRWGQARKEWPCRIFSRIAPLAETVSVLKTVFFTRRITRCFGHFCFNSSHRTCCEHMNLCVWIISKPDFENFSLRGVFPCPPKQQNGVFWVPLYRCFSAESMILWCCFGIKRSDAAYIKPSSASQTWELQLIDQSLMQPSIVQASKQLDPQTY